MPAYVNTSYSHRPFTSHLSPLTFHLSPFITHPLYVPSIYQKGSRYPISPKPGSLPKYTLLHLQSIIPMLSYIVAFLAFILFFSNPIAKFFFPASTLPSSDSPRPQLNESLLALPSPNDTELSCNADAYSVRILSSAPLVLYIENFLTQDERSHLLDIRSVRPVPPYPPARGETFQPQASQTTPKKR